MITLVILGIVLTVALGLASRAFKSPAILLDGFLGMIFSGLMGVVVGMNYDMPTDSNQDDKVATVEMVNGPIQAILPSTFVPTFRVRSISKYTPSVTGTKRTLVIGRSNNIQSSPLVTQTNYVGLPHGSPDEDNTS
jgi:hypothetical protein